MRIKGLKDIENFNPATKAAIAEKLGLQEGGEMPRNSKYGPITDSAVLRQKMIAARMALDAGDLDKARALLETVKK